MIRLYENHKIRKVKELDGMCDFLKEDGKSYKLPYPVVGNSILICLHT